MFATLLTTLELKIGPQGKAKNKDSVVVVFLNKS